MDAEQFYVGLWESLDVADPSLALATSLRDAGLGVHLVTNQHPRRAALMKRTLGYEAVLDRCFYSCDLGVAKPDAQFFSRVLEVLGAAPEETLLVDDSAANVASAPSRHWVSRPTPRLLPRPCRSRSGVCAHACEGIP